MLLLQHLAAWTQHIEQQAITQTHAICALLAVLKVLL
jgi:hypothetical protein